MNLEEGIIDFPKIVVVLRSNEISGAVTDQSKIKAQRKRRLFEDFNEIFAQRKKDIEERKRIQQEKDL